MTMTRLQDRFDLAKQVPAPDLAEELDQRLREVSPLPIDGRPHIAQRVVVGAAALIIFIVAGAFAWSAFRPSGESATVGSNDSTALVATLEAPEDGAIPGLTLAYGDMRHDYFAEGGHWPGVKGFNQPGFTFGDSLPPGTSLMIAGDASHVEGDLSKFIEDRQSTADIPPFSLDLTRGSATLPTDPGRYSLHLTGTWPQGTAEFWVVINIAPPSLAAGPTPTESVNPGATSDIQVATKNGNLAATWSLGDQTRTGVPVEVLQPEPSDSTPQGSPVYSNGSMTDILGFSSFSIDRSTLDQARLDPLSLPAGSTVASAPSNLMLFFFTGSQGSGGSMTPLYPTPVDLSTLAAGSYRVVVAGQMSDGSSFQFAFAIEVAATSTPSHQLGVNSVPVKAMQLAVGALNSHACNTGSLDTVTTMGATTSGDLGSLLPYLNADQTWPQLADDTPVYAAVVIGDCSSGGQRYRQGYVLFDQEGNALFWRTWNAGMEPTLDSPFGLAANEALGI
jgi:hypothetical protein